MSPLKIAAVVAIIGVGLVGSFLVIRNASPALKTPVETLLTPVTAPLPSSSSPGSSPPSSQYPPAASFTAKTPRNENLSEKFAEKLFNKIVGDNPEGPQAGAGDYFIKANTSGLIEDFIKEALAESDSQPIVVKDEDIKITSDNSDAAFAAYFRKLKNIVEKTINTPRFQESAKALSGMSLLNNENGELNLNSYVQAAAIMEETYDQVAKELFTVSVPSDLKELHKEGLVVALVQKKMMNAFKFAESDPLKALVIMQTAKKEDVNIVGFFSKIDKIVQERGLNI